MTIGRASGSGFALAAVLTVAGCHLPAPMPRLDVENLRQREITAPVDLVDGEGRLIAPSWSSRPVHRYDRAALRGDLDLLRQWDYFAIMASDVVLEITLADIRFAGFCNALVHELATGQQWLGARGALNPRTVVEAFPADTSGPVDCLGSDGRHLITTRPLPGGAREIAFDFRDVRFSAPVSGVVVLGPPPGHRQYVGVFPFPGVDGGFFYENKVPGMPVTGTVDVGEAVFELGGDAFAVRDWGRGIWPPKLVWQWGMAGGEVDGHRLDFNLGAGFGDVTQGTENIAFVDGVPHKLGIVNWAFDRSDRLQPWTFEDPAGRFHAVLTPTAEQPLRANLLVKGVRIHKAYGTLAGWVVLDDGTKLAFDGLRGFAEEVYIRW